MLPTLLIRTEAGARVGLGHAMRCLALAQAWRRLGGAVCFVMRECPPSFAIRLSGAGCQLKMLEATDDDAGQTARAASAASAAWIVVDGYGFTDGYRARLQKHGFAVLAIDDEGGPALATADAVLNQNHHARAEHYPKVSRNCRLLLGTRYVLLRDEFFPLRGEDRAIREQPELLVVTLGGSDPAGLTAPILEAFAADPPFAGAIDFVIGPAFGARHELEERLGQLNRPWQLLSGPPNWPRLMRDADLAVTAGGSTCWELAYLGTPMITVAVAPNQLPIAASVEGAGAGVNLGPSQTLSLAQLTATTRVLLASPGQRRALSQAGRQLVDGRGSERVAEFLGHSSATQNSLHACSAVR